MIWFPAKKMNKLSDKSDDDDEDYDDRNDNNFFGDNDEEDGDYGRLSVDEDAYGNDGGIYNKNKTFYEPEFVNNNDNMKRIIDVYNDKINEDGAQRMKSKVLLSVVGEEENQSNKCWEFHEHNQCNVKVFIKKNSFDGLDTYESQEKVHTSKENRKTPKAFLHDAYDTKTTETSLNNPPFYARVPNIFNLEEKNKKLNKNFSSDFKNRKNNFKKDIKNNKKESFKNEKLSKEEDYYSKSQLQRPNKTFICADVTECKSEGNKPRDFIKKSTSEPVCKKPKIWSIDDVIN